MNVPPNHPLAELLATLLLGIEVVPQKEQRKMVTRAIKEAVKWHEKAMADTLQAVVNAGYTPGGPQAGDAGFERKCH